MIIFLDTLELYIIILTDNSSQMIHQVLFASNLLQYKIIFFHTVDIVTQEFFCQKKENFAPEKNTPIETSIAKKKRTRWDKTKSSLL